MNINANLTASGHDIRLNLFLGLANWFIFLDHIPNNFVNWITVRNYGFSGAADLFIFISGYTATTVYGKMMLERGFIVGATRLLKRAWQLYAAYVVLFVIYIVVIGYVAAQYAPPNLLNEFNVTGLIDHPIRILAHGLLLQSKARNLDAPQLYTLLMLLFPPVLWTMLRWPALTVLGSIALYFAARRFGWNLASFPDGDWYFNPFCWQLLFVFGACVALEGASQPRATHQSTIALYLAAVYLAFALLMTMAGRFPEFGAVFPAWLFDALNANDKENLAPYRVLHFLVVAFFVTRFVPKDWSGLNRPIFRPLVKCGEQSLAVFCVGVFLSVRRPFHPDDEFGVCRDADARQRDRDRGHDHDRLLHLLVQTAGRLENARPRLAALLRVLAEYGVGQPQRQGRHIGDDAEHDQQRWKISDTSSATAADSAGVVPITAPPRFFEAGRKPRQAKTADLCQLAAPCSATRKSGRADARSWFSSPSATR